MNRIYKVVFNRALGAYGAVSELASFKGKKSIKCALAVGLAGLMMAGSVSAAGSLSGGKSGYPVDSGDTQRYTGVNADNDYATSSGSVVSEGYEGTVALYGGYVYANQTGEDIQSNNNTVTVKNGSDITSPDGTAVVGGKVHVSDYMTVGNAEISGNQVVLENSVTVSGDIAGASLGSYNANVGAVTANDNKVDAKNLNAGGSTVRGFDMSINQVGGDVTATGNNVTVDGNKLNYTGALNLYWNNTAEQAKVNVTVYENTTSLKNVEIAGAVHGTSVSSYSGNAEKVSVTRNKTEIENLKLSDYGENLVYGTVVSFSDGTVNGSVDVSENLASVKGIEEGQAVSVLQAANVSIGKAGGNITVSNNKASMTNGFASAYYGDYAANVTVASTVEGSEVDLKVEGNEFVFDNIKSTTADYLTDIGGANVTLGNYWSSPNINNLSVNKNKVTVTGGSLLGDNVFGAGVTSDGVISGKTHLDGNAISVTGDSATDTRFNSVNGVKADLNKVGGDISVSENSVSLSNATVSEEFSVAEVNLGETVDGSTVNVKAEKNTGSLTDVVLGEDVKELNGVKFKAPDVKVNDISLNENKLTLTNVETKNADAKIFAAQWDGLDGKTPLPGKIELNNNEVSVTGQSVDTQAFDDVTAAYIWAIPATGPVSATGNKATLLNVNIAGSVRSAEVIADNAVVTNNVTTVKNSVAQNVYAAEVSGDNATVTGNTVTVTDSKVGEVGGTVVDGKSAEISGNTVNIGGNSEVRFVFGALAYDDNTVTNNTINLSGNTTFGEQGGMLFAGIVSESDNGVVSNNTVNVTDNVKLSNVDLYGRFAGFGEGDNTGTGNTLNLNNWKGKDIKSVNYFDNINVNTSSAEPEQVVIQELQKTPDTKFNIGLDGKASRELEEKASTPEDAAIQASKVLKLVNVDGSDTHNEKFNVNIAEGDVTGEITAVIEENGTVDNIDVKVKAIAEKENSVMKSLTNIAANNFLVFRQQMNDLNKRMGDLRTMPQSDGVWGRAVAGQAEYKQMHSTYKTLQVGADKRIGQFLVGATASYTDADGSLKNGSSDDKNYTYGIYGSWLGDNGHYVDVIVKRHHVQSDYDLRYTDGRKTDGMMHTSGTSISAEYGKRFAITNTNFYVEPQVEVMWGHLDSDSYKLSNGVRIKQDGIDSLIGRLGVAAGWVSPDKKGSAYIKASVLNDWEAESDVTARKGATVRKYTEDMGGTWGEFAIGGTYNFGKNFSAYGEVETTAGNPTRTTYQASAGIRYSF